eukprot:scaffold9033_cov120-Skeletonema_marinoi.AAC.1
MNTSPTTTTCPLVNETGTEIVSPTGSKLSSIALDAAEEANDDASFVVVGAASPKAKTMKEVLLRCGCGLAVAVVIALAGKGFVARAHNAGTDDVMMNVDLAIDSNSSKQVAVALLDGDGDGKNVANYDFTKVDGGVSTVRTLEESTSYTFTEATLFEQFVGDNECFDSQSQSRFYPYIRYGSVSSAEECGDMCSMCPGNDQGGLVLRGFMYFGQCNECECLVDFDSNGFDKTVCEGADFAYDANEGSGEIVNTTPFPDVQCWKVSSPSVAQPSDQPSDLPSN